MSEQAVSVDFRRGGFWRRALALLIDVAAVSVVMQLATLVLFPVTNGNVQFSGGLAYAFHCQPLDKVPDQLDFPADFGATSIADCEQTVLGLPSSRVLRITRTTVSGLVTKNVSVGYMLDRAGKPIHGLPLEILLLPLLITLRFSLDCFGGSLGRRICRVHLADAADGHCPPPVARAGRRYAAVILSLLPVWTCQTYSALFPSPELLGSTLFWSCWIGSGLLSLIAVIAAIVAIARGKDAWYDRFVGTCVVRPGQARSLTAAPPPIPADSDLDGQYLPPQALPPPLPQPMSRNYFVRHWRGELSLPVSYWVNGIVCGLAAGLVIAALGWFIQSQGEARPWLWLVSLSSIWLFVALLTAWQAVGVWRSATHYRQGGGTFWGGVAQAVVVLAVLQSVANFIYTGSAQIAGIYEIVAGDSRVGPHQFHVLANGSTLEFYGGITFGVADEMDRFLDAMSSVRTVRLNSIGGRILEAQKMADSIRRRNLSTFVARDCLSACTIVFLGGKDRFMLPTARLGFHQPSFRGMTAIDRKNAIVAEGARLQRFGLSKEFAEHANSALPSSMWFPTTDELLREHVVTRLIPLTQKIATSPTDAPPSNAAPPAPDGSTLKPIATVPVVRPSSAPSFPPVFTSPPLPAAPPSPVATSTDPVAPASNPPLARIPTDVLQRLNRSPKPATTAQPATQNAEQKRPP